MLEAISPSEAVELYIEDRASEISDSTAYKYRHQLKAFVQWCEENGVGNLNHLTGRKVQQFKQWRGERLKPITLRTNLWTVRSFIQFCEHINGVPEGVFRKVRIPEVSEEGEVRHDRITKEEADAILEHLGKFEYATFRHALFLTLWKTGVRMGTLRALDVADFSPARSSLRIRHRPESGTPLKNKHRAERMISISGNVVTVLEDYIAQNHPQKEDEYGRLPLFVADTMRATKTAIQRNIYAPTRPCYYTNTCPHDREIESCEAQSYNSASKCPSSCGPHALRKGYVTAALKAGQAPDVTGERTNMARETLDKHYDQRTEGEQMNARKRHLKDI